MRLERPQKGGDRGKQPRRCAAAAKPVSPSTASITSKSALVSKSRRIFRLSS